DRSLEKHPEDRYQQARDIVLDLRDMQRSTGGSSVIRAAVTSPSASPTKVTPSIAVLPFVDMSLQKDQDYLCEGMAVELINALASVPGLRVASRTSAFQFKGQSRDIGEIGARLKADTVLEGSVQTAGNRLRVMVQLISSSAGYQMWSARYDRD